MSERAPQAFADAICNAQPRTADGLYAHARKRYRGMEGTNGVACDACRAFADRAWAEYQRILANLRLNTPA